MRPIGAGWALGVGIALSAGPTLAQETGAAPTQWEPFGLEVDASITTSGGYVSNIFATENDIRDDLVTIVAPELGISKQGDGYSFALGGSAEIGSYLDYTSEDYVDGVVRGEGRVKVAPDVFLFGGADHAWEHEERSSPSDVGGEEPTRYRDATGFAGISGRFGDVTARAGANVQRLDFDDVPAGGLTFNNDDRDRVESEFGGRVGYFVSPGTQVFGQAIYDSRDYDDSTDDFGFRRDSDGFQAALGIAGRWGDVSGEVLAGALVQDYDDPRFGTVVVPDIGAELTWRAGPATRVTGTLQRAIEETTIVGASSYVRTTGGARVVRRVAPDLSLIGYAFLTENDYEEVSRTDYVAELGADLRYYMTPHTFAGFSYGWESRTSDAAGADYDAHTFMLSLGADLDPAFGPDSALASSSASGFYLGAFGADGAVQTAVDGPRGGGGTLVADFGDFGQSGGLFAGWRTMVGDLALGVEVEAELSNADWEHRGGRTFSTDRENSLGAGVLVGHETTNGVLLYGRAGLGSTRFESRYARAGNSATVTERETGPRFALGAEFPVGDSLSGRMEYVYTSYDDFDIGAPLGQSDDSFANTDAMARFGLAYHFGGQRGRDVTPVDFSGAYGGLQVGHGTLVTEDSGFRPNDAAPNFLLEVTRSGQGLSGGPFGGYGETFGNVYLGVEAEAEFSNADWNIERDPDGRVYSLEKRASFGGAVRAGYILNDTVLLYARGGAVGTRFDTDFTTVAGSVSQTDFQVGARFGGGMEFGLDDNFRARLDYTRTLYPGYSVNNALGTESLDTDENLFRLGLIYSF